jgi:hypothetical protein
MIIPSNLTFASPDDGSDDDGSENQDDGSSDEGTTEEDDQTEPEETEEQLTEEPIEELPSIDEVPIDPCVEDPDACALEPEPPADPCLDNPDLPECQAPADPCLDNPNLPECQSPVICPDGGDPLSDGSCPPILCPDGGDPLSDGSCPPVPCPVGKPDGSCPPVPCPVGKPGCPLPPCDPTEQQCPPECGPGTHLENGQCVPNKRGGSSSSSSSSSTATANLVGAEVSSCRLDGNAHGIQQKFNPVRYQVCGLYTSADKAYYDGFVAGCMQVGNTKLICETVANSNIVTPLAQTQSTTQPTQAIQPSGVS